MAAQRLRKKEGSVFQATGTRGRALRRVVLPLAMIVAMVPVLSAPATERSVKKAKKNDKVNLQILSLNDFHGNLEPPSGSSGRVTLPEGGTVDAGGAEYLATHIKSLQEGQEHSIFVAAGDLIGASPLLSALFHDEPTIEAMNLMGLKISSVGNHEFDEGSDELLRMQNGGCHPTDGCQDGDDFEGAGFQYLSANVFKEGKNKTLLPPYKIRRYEGIKVGFIGLTLEGTPTIVTPSGVAGLDFRDEARTTNKLVRKLRRNQGVKAFVVLIHEGGFQTGTYDGCDGISGPIVDIVERTTPQVDMFISGHTHQAYNCVIDGRPVTSSSSFGRIVTDYDVVLDKSTNDVSSIEVGNVIVTRDVARDLRMTGLIGKYARLSEELRNEVVGQITEDIVRAQNTAGESPLGDLIADAQLEATAPEGFGEAVVAFMNPGGIRADLVYEQSGSEGDGTVTYEEAFTVQPFSNTMTVMTLTGAQIETLLEQQWSGGNEASPKVLQVSDGFTYSWDALAASGDRVDPANILLNGVAIDPAASYRVAVNNFLADGGDNFVVLREGTDRLGGDVDIDAFVDYIRAHSPVSSPVPDRILLEP
ncbi:MAG: bifunctional metallophosphatase/5'-nucleotidase [Actinobacteria bacterium]|nr:bifunctional metallophosphatase/5'-nucleotidase [Actinomycetota bacterium]